MEGIGPTSQDSSNREISVKFIDLAFVLKYTPGISCKSPMPFTFWSPLHGPLLLGYFYHDDSIWLMNVLPLTIRIYLFIGYVQNHGSECWTVKKKDDNRLNSAEMRILRWARLKTRLDHIRNEDIGKEAYVQPVETFLENKKTNVVLSVLEARSRCRPKKRWRDNIQGDLKKKQLTEDMPQDRKYWMTKILAADGQKRWERWDSSEPRIIHCT